MSKCVFYSCSNVQNLVDAHFVSETSNKRLEVIGKVCPLHDRYTRGGGELSILFGRDLARESQTRYAHPSGPTLPGAGPERPPTTGGE